MRKKIICIFLCLIAIAAAVLASARAKRGRDVTVSTENATVLNETSSKSVVCGINSTSSDWFSVQDNGFLGFKNGVMYYYDFASDQAYVVCGKVNCKHDDKTCLAWGGMGNELTGVAYYQSKIYYFQDNLSKNELTLSVRNPDGTGDKTIWCLQKGTFDENDHIWGDITDVYYVGDSVYFILGAYYMVSQGEFPGEDIIVVSNILCRLSLDAGNLDYLTPIPTIDEMVQHDTQAFLLRVARDYIIYQIREINSSESAEIICSEKNYALSTDNSEEISFLFEDIYPVKKTDSFIINYQSRFGCIGASDNNVYFYHVTNDSTSKNSIDEIFRIDISTKETTSILSQQIAGIPRLESSICESAIIDDSFFLYGIYSETEEDLIIFKFDLSSLSSLPVYEDTASMKYRIQDFAKNDVIIKTYVLTDIAVHYNLYRIPTDAYLKNDFSELIQIAI